MVRTNRQVADTLLFMAELLEIAGGDVYKIRAYQRAASEIGRLDAPVGRMTVDELQGIRGIGKAIAEKIQTIAATGTFPELEEQKAAIPSSLLELLRIGGVGPKTVRKLWTKLSILSVDDLEKAARAHRIRAVPTFGEKKEADILAAIAFYRQAGGRMTLPEADAVVTAVTAPMAPGSFTVAGSYRRGKSTVGDIDIVSTESPRVLNRKLRAIAEEVINEGNERTSIRIRGQRVDIRYTDPGELGSMLVYLTGSRDFNIRLRDIALGRGLRVNEYGIEERENGTLHRFSTEEEMFRFMGMDPIPPELRENWGEIERAFAHDLPMLVGESDIRGDLHVHTNRSDGHLTLEEVAAAGAASGYEYVLVTDHASALGITHGLDAAAIADQRRGIEAVNRSSSCQLLHGIEVDIAADGTLGLPAGVLADLDLVIASVHTGFKQDSDRMTRRIVSAMENEHVDIIGHPTGRLLGERPAYDVDLGRLYEAAKDTKTAIEINASPHRLDLDDIEIKQARERGALLAIGTDTHYAHEFAYMRYGVILARRGWCEPSNLLNTRTAGDLMEKRW